TTTSAAGMGYPSSFPGLEAARNFLFAVRSYLHYDARRDSNSLSFDAQEAMAEFSNKPNPAEWMREYFRHARDIYRASTRFLEASEAQSSSLFSQFRDWRSRLSTADFTVLRERVYFKSPHQIEQHPMLALRCFEFVRR